MATYKPVILNSDLQNFALMAQYKSISAVARKTGQDGGNLSRYLSRLEKSFGHALFVRHKGGLEPTDLGKKLLRALGAAQREFDIQFEGLNKRHIRVGFSPAIGFAYYAKYFLETTLQAQLIPEFTIAPSMELFEKLKSRELDLVLAPRSLGFLGTIEKQLTSDRLVLCSTTGTAQKNLLVNAQMFDFEKALKSLKYETRWLLDDYFVLAKFVAEQKQLMGIIPSPLLKYFPKLKTIKVFKAEGRITAFSWPGSVGVELIKRASTT